MILLVLSMVASAIILVHGLFKAINKMNRNTCHRMRFSWVLMTTGAMGVLVSPLYGIWRPTLWETVLFAGFSLHVIFDRRTR